MDLSVLLLNCHSLNSKLGEIKIMLYSKKPELFCVSETWITNREPKFINYVTEWKHRDDGRRGGGVGLIIRRDVQYEIVNLKMFNLGVLEVQAIKLKMKDTDLCVLHIYNPNKNVTIAELQHYMKQLGKTYLVVGDFNAQSAMLDSKCRKQNATGKMLEDILMTNQLCLINPRDFYTFLCSSTGKLSCLDLCLTTPDIAAETEVKLCTDVGSDHRTVNVILKRQLKFRTMVHIKKWKTTKETLEKFKRGLEDVDIIKPNDVESISLEIKKKINSAAEQNIGQTSGKASTKKRTCWWNIQCSKAVAERRLARRRVEKHPTRENVKIYQKKTQECKMICSQSKRNSFQEYIATLTYDTPMTNVWRKINSLKTQYRPQNYPIKENGILIEEEIEKANVFLTNYIKNSRITKNDSKKHQMFIDEFCRKEDEEINKDITKEELTYALRASKSTTPGEDGIPCSLLKYLNEQTLSDLLQLYNQSFHTGVIPQNWKLGIVIPILKPDKPKEKVTSYRPITLLNTMGKLLERIIKRRMEFKLEKEVLLSGYQCGYRRGQGTTTALIRLENEIRKSLDKGEVCIVVYFDLANAFDKVWHTGILYKLARMGFKGDILRWLRNYFINRKIKVRIDGQYSEELPILAGVPQGAVLSPLLFNVIMSDMPEEDGIKLYVYADDITISSSAKDVAEVKRRMDNYIKRLVGWAKEWGIEINPGKTSMQHYTKRRIQYPIIRLERNPIKYLQEKTLLGIILDSPALTFRKHITKLKVDCTRRIDMMKVMASTKWGGMQQDSQVILFGLYTNKNRLWSRHLRKCTYGIHRETGNSTKFMFKINFGS